MAAPASLVCHRSPRRGRCSEVALSGSRGGSASRFLLSVFAELRPRAAAIPLLAAAILFAAPFLPGAGGAAQAQQTQVLVSNFNQPGGVGATLANFDHALAFTTGRHSGGYTLTSVKLAFDFGNLSFTASINADNNGEPGSALGTLTRSASESGLLTHAGINLAANTTYFLVFDVASGNRDGATTASNAQTGLTGWSIADGNLYRNRDATSGSWTTWSNSFRMRISGIAKGTVPTPTATISPVTSPVTEGAAASFMVTLSSAAPSEGVTVNLSVSEAAGSDYVTPGNEGSKRVTFAEGETRKTYRVATVDDGNDEPDGSVTATLSSGAGYNLGSPASASVTVRDNDQDTQPSFGDRSIANQSYTENVPIPALTLPAAASGDGTLRYSLSPAPPAGLSFDAGTRRLSGAPSGTQAAATYTYTATDDDGDTDTLTFTIAVAAAPPGATPTFGARSIPNQSYTQGVGIAALTLPRATGGNGTLRYSLSPAPPAGLSFDDAPRRLTGVPTAIQDAAAYSYTVTDADGDTATLSFTIAIEDGATEIEVPDDLPAELRRVPRNAALSADGVVTWDLDTATEPDRWTTYWVQWVWDEQPPTRMVLGRAHAGDATLRETRCSGGSCEVRIEEFDPGRHYLVHVTTLERALRRLPAATLRHVPAPDEEAPKVSGLPEDVAVSGTGLVTWRVPVSEGDYTVAWASGDRRLETVPTRGGQRGGLDTVRARDCEDRLCRLQIPRFDAARHWVVEVNALDRKFRGREPVRVRHVPEAAPGETVAGGPARFRVYHDPSDGTAVERFDEAMAAFRAAGIVPEVIVAAPHGEPAFLAGYPYVRMPRFFVGEPLANGRYPGACNGGLRWLKTYLANLPGVSAADARVREADGATVDFAVTLDKAAATAATVDFATADGTATAGEDYTAASGTLTFAAGETSKTVSVAVLDDAYDEGEETFTLTLSNAAGLRIADGEATGTIVNTDPLPLPGAAPPTGGGTAPRFTIYHDRSDPAAVARYGQAVRALGDAGVSHQTRHATGAEAGALAGVGHSVMPRFFLGDPAASGWGPSQPKVNNGGLRWLLAYIGNLPGLSVADARVTEAEGARLDFAVTLGRAATASVTVAWATADGTARAGADYTAASGTLTFAPGETSKTVSVAVLDDAHDEGAETLTLRLSNAAGARIVDGEATGTIGNADPLQKDWLARFGRAAASGAIAAITTRLEIPLDAGSHLTLGGQRIALDGSGGAGAQPGEPVGASRPSWSGGPDRAESQTMNWRELLMGTSFRAVFGGGAGPQFTSWGRGASVSQFSSAGSGLSLSGETATGSLGMDYERGRLLTGFAMTHSIGEGTAQGAGRSYVMGSTVTTMLPYARLALSERVSAWGLVGTGSGQLSLDLDGGAAERYRADLTMTLTAMGVQGALLTPAEAGGFALALKADGFWVRTESDGVSTPGVGNLVGAQAEASRLRAVLDGSRRFTLAGGRTLTPSAALGLRHDGGDAETGTGVEVGAGLGYADPSRGLDMGLRLHGLAAHAEEGYSEWSVSGSLRLVPGGRGRGLSASLTPSYGADPGGADRLWTMPDAHALAANDDTPLSRRLDGELGYGLAVFGGRLTGTPHVGFGLSDTARELRLGWRLTPAGGSGFELGLDAARREAGGGDMPEHRIGVGFTARW